MSGEPLASSTPAIAQFPEAGWKVCHPSAALQHLLPPDVARSNRAVVVGEAGEVLQVAVTDPRQPGLAATLAAAAHRPVALLAADGEEIAIALALCSADPTVQQRRRRRLTALAASIGLGAQVDAAIDTLFEPAGAARPSGDECWGPELLGLLEGLPHLDLAADHFPPSFELLLPLHLRSTSAAAPLAPWAVFGEWLLLGCATNPDPEATVAIEIWTGLRVRPILCSPEVLRAASARALIPRTLMVGDARIEVEARALRSSAEALDLLPAALCRSLTILPLAADRGWVEVAVASDTIRAAEIPALLEALCGRTVRMRSATAVAVRRALLRAYSMPSATAGPPATPPVPPPGWWATYATGLPRWQVLAALVAVPSISMEHYNISLPLARLAPPSTWIECGAVPLRREDAVLWVAVSTLDPGALEIISERTGCAIRPLLAGAIAEATIATNSGTTHPAPQHPIVAYPIAKASIDAPNTEAVQAGAVSGLDLALDAAAILSAARFVNLAAMHSGLPQAELPLSPEADPAGASDGLSADLAERPAVLPRHTTDEVPVVAVADPFEPDTARALDTLGRRQRLVVAPREAIQAAREGAVRPEAGQPRLGELLVANGIIAAPELDRALALQRSHGVRLGQALIYLGLLSQEQLAYFLAEQGGLLFLNFQDMHPQPEMMRLLPQEMERRLGVVPLYETRTAEEGPPTLLVATSDPLNRAMLDEVGRLTGRIVSPIVCTERDLEALLEAFYRDDYLQRSTSYLITRSPDESASKVLNRAQQVALGIAALLLIVLGWRFSTVVGVTLSAACSLFYVTFSLYRCYLIYKALRVGSEVKITEAELAAIDEATLPIYTILLPLYREAAVLPILLAGLTRIDYPFTKLDVKLLLEEDDLETRAAADAIQLPAYVHPVIVPASLPRGKPKACNYGLIHAQGEFVVIYDGEDVPDPDQLKKAVLAFRKLPPTIACLQAKLNYFNSQQNLLTRWFTIEYSMWFDLFLPGLDAAKVPIPLGGTSNHFPTAKLLEAGAWDPYNVTEDADLGIRIFRHGWTTAVLDSTTYEEATSQVYNWVRQRSRWVKGYVQTFLVHTRHPIKLWRAVGTKAFFSFNLVVGGTFIGFLLNPVFWLLTILWYLVHAAFVRTLFPPAVFYMGAVSLFIGNFAFMYLNVAGCIRRGYYHLVPYALLSPIYWMLMSLAAWKGFLQLCTNPFYWEKTVHGHYKKPGSGKAGH